MTNVQARNQRKSKPVAAPRATKPATSKSAEKAKLKPITASESSGSQQDLPVTKHEQVLALLSKPDGATIADLMDATDWQQHSVRGFLAGTVKMKLGLALTSSKAEGETRRYRIVTRPGR